MHAPMSIVSGVDFIGSAVIILFSFHALVLMRRFYRGKKEFSLYAYLYAQTITLAIFAISRSVGHIANHVLIATGYSSVWKSLAPISGSINSLSFIAFGVAALFYSNIKAVSERVDALENSRRDLKASKEQISSSLREKEVLLRELHHRVKNNMAIMSSLQNLQLRFVKDETSLKALRESRDRIRSMALVHEMLYKSKDLSTVDVPEYLGSLVKNIYSSFGVPESRIAFKVAAEGVSLGVNTLIPCGLIVNELVTNAIKHAFREAREGTLTIGLSKSGPRVSLTVSDDGCGLPEGFDMEASDTLGLQLVNSLIAQMDGEMSIDRSAGGTSVRVTLTERA